MDFLSNPQFQMVAQLLLAIFLGGIIGFEREVQKRTAGLRTNSLVCLGATLFTSISLNASYQLSGEISASLDPSRVIAAIVTGVGFIGAGLIIYRGFKVEGITTAAGIWTVAAIGVAIGTELYLVAIFTTFLVLGILNILRTFESKIIRKKNGFSSKNTNSE